MGVHVNKEASGPFELNPIKRPHRFQSLSSWPIIKIDLPIQIVCRSIPWLKKQSIFGFGKLRSLAFPLFFLMTNKMVGKPSVHDFFYLWGMTNHVPIATTATWSPTKLKDIHRPLPNKLLEGAASSTLIDWKHCLQMHMIAEMTGQ